MIETTPIPDLEARAEALLMRLQQHSLAEGLPAESEIRSLLQEIQSIIKLNVASEQSADSLVRVRWIMERAVAEAKNILRK